MDKIGQIVTLADTTLGVGYVTRKQVSELMCNSKVVFKTTEVGNKIVGVAWCFVGEDKALLKTIYVSENSQGKGVGYTLLKGILDEVIEKGVHEVECVAWKNTLGNINSEKLLIKGGFTRFTELTLFYHDDSIKKGYICPHCKGTPCMCSAVVFKKYIGLIK